MGVTSEKTERYFQKRAREFDALYDEKLDWRYVLNHIFRRPLYDRVRLTVEEFEGLEHFAVLDVGCGSGRNSVIFARRGARRVVGVDFAANMIALAHDYARSKGLEECCEFIQADALQYSSPCKFDVVVALGVFDYIDDPRNLLRRMMALSSGKVIATFPGPSLLRAPLRKLRYKLRDCPVYFFSRHRLENICAEIGLRDFRLVPMGGAGHLLVGKVAG